MEEIKKNNSNNFKEISSPFLNYYSHIINPSDPQYNSEMSKFTEIYQNNNQAQKFEKIELKFNNQFIIKDNKEQYTNINSESNKINFDIKKETEINSINNINLREEKKN